MQAYFWYTVSGHIFDAGDIGRPVIWTNSIKITSFSFTDPPVDDILNCPNPERGNFLRARLLFN